MTFLELCCKLGGNLGEVFAMALGDCEFQLRRLARAISSSISASSIRSCTMSFIKTKNLWLDISKWNKDQACEEKIQ